jgi:cytochrome c peroxidase
VGAAGLIGCSILATAQDVAPRGKTSFSNVDGTESFASVVERMVKAKAGIEKEHQALLAERYDLADHPVAGLTMSRGKAVQGGVRVKLANGSSWDAIGALSPEEIKQKNLWPKGFLPLPHPNHPEGGMLFPKFHIDEVKAQTGRDLARFDLDFQTPDHLLPEFPPAIFLTTRPDLGDVSQGKLVTSDNFFRSWAASRACSPSRLFPAAVQRHDDRRIRAEPESPASDATALTATPPAYTSPAIYRIPRCAA